MAGSHACVFPDDIFTDHPRRCSLTGTGSGMLANMQGTKLTKARLALATKFKGHLPLSP